MFLKIKNYKIGLLLVGMFLIFVANTEYAEMVLKDTLSAKSKTQITLPNQIQLEKLCSIKEGFLSYSKLPMDLSVEKAGKALLFLNDGRYAVFRAPDCKIISRYSTASFLNNIISRDGTVLFSKDRSFGSSYVKNNKGTFGLETHDGKVIALTPPENFDQRNSEFPKISIDGSAVLWKVTGEKRKYYIQDKAGKQMPGPLVWDRGTPYLFDMKQKTYVSISGDSLKLLNWDGEIIAGPQKIPEAKLYLSYDPPIKLLSGDLKNWVGWETALVSEMAPEGPFVIWNTGAGKGRYDFGKMCRVSNVSVSADGLYIAVAHMKYPDKIGRIIFSKKVEFIVTLISTATGEIVYEKILAAGNDSGMVSHRVAFLKNDFIAINNTVAGEWAQTDSVNLFKIIKNN